MINWLTLSRLTLLVPMAALLVVAGQSSWVVFVIFMVAAASDYLDGYFARKFNQSTPFGAMLDHVCDKIFVMGILITLVAIGALRGIGLVPVLVMMAREFWVLGLRDFARQNVMALPVDRMGKIKTFVQMVSLAFLLFPYDGALYLAQQFSGFQWLYPAGAVLLWVAALLSVISAAGYTRKILRPTIAATLP